MVTFAELRDARPNLRESAADDILDVSKQAERTADNIHANGVDPLVDHWPDHTGTLARDSLASCANRMVNAGILARGVATALDTLEDAIGIAQRMLVSVTTFATSRNLTVDENGTVAVPDDTSAEDYYRAILWRDEAQSMIDDAVEAASQADRSCLDAITACSVDPDSVSSDTAREKQAQAVQAALKEMRNLLPDGQPPEEVRRWWAGLTPEQQLQLKRAVPVGLADLDGLSKDVKRELTDSGRGHDPVETVRFAIANAENDELDIFGSILTPSGSSSSVTAGKQSAWIRRCPETSSISTMRSHMNQATSATTQR